MRLWTLPSSSTRSTGPGGPFGPSPAAPVHTVALNPWLLCRAHVPVKGGPAGLMSWMIMTLPAAKLRTDIEWSFGSLSLCRFTIQLPVMLPLLSWLSPSLSPLSAIADDDIATVLATIAPAETPLPDSTRRRSIPVGSISSSLCRSQWWSPEWVPREPDTHGASRVKPDER